MESIIRGTVVYAFVWLLLRVAGKRTLTQATTFDLALLLIISETTQQAMIGTDSSVTHAFLLIVTLIGLDILLACGKMRWRSVDRWMDGVPVLVLEHGRILEEPARRSRLDASDILEAARTAHGLERLDQVKFAVLERSGDISIIPAERKPAVS
jgi:uncharacterized membrane protein YcaP (DUF421 family)